MHIKKLEICGFKSFIDRTVIQFDHDMIGVVGPNGCGKSNVVDAIRWAMGEQSAKSLRGRAMSDIIFNGSESRAQAGFAEVTLTFDNSNPEMKHVLPPEYRDYSEIAVTRRLHRGDGSNDYLINKTPVRLRDVTEVFLGTGVGRKAYSIVEQGKIGLIVSTRPHDRRVLIEEAAGITKYKARKRQAEQKMLLTRQNLARVSDLVGEIERQLGSLKRQSAKANRYVRYRDELDDLMLWDAAHKWLELRGRRDVTNAERAIKDHAVTAERAEVDARDAAIEVMRQESHGAERRAENAQNAAFMCDNQVREHETSMDRARDRYELLDTALERARAEQLDLVQKATALNEERGTLHTDLGAVDGELQREESLVAHEVERLAELERAASDAAVALATRRESEASASTAIAAGEARIDAIERRRGELDERTTRIAEQLSVVADQLREGTANRQALSTNAHDLEVRKCAMVNARDALADDLPKLIAERDAVRAHSRESRDMLHRAANRLRALQELAERMEGVGAGVRHLLQTGDSTLGGLLADRIEVPTELTHALAALVGDRLQCVVVEDLDRGMMLLEGLAASENGRASIIANSLTRRATVPDTKAEPFSVDPGVIGSVLEQLNCGPADESVVRALVGSAVLVQDSATAKRLSERGADADLVTLDGTVFHRDGRITGGSGDALAEGMLDQKREIRELESTVAQRENDVASYDARIDEIEARVTKTTDALEHAKDEAHQAEIAMISGQQELRRLEQDLTQLNQRHAAIIAEQSELLDAVELTAVERAALLATLELATDELENSRQARDEAEKLSDERRAAHALQHAVCTDRKVMVASVRERASAARDALARVERAHEELRERIVALESSRDATAHEAGEVAAQWMSSRGGMLDARRESRQAHSSFETARVELDDTRQRLSLREAELREMRGQLDDNSAQLQDLEMQLQRFSLELEHLVEAVAERFRGLDLRTVVGDFHARAMMSDEQQRRIKELTQLIDRMGSVNLEAMEQFKESSERFEFYTKQRGDLEQALSDLEKAIAQMNKESRRLFKHAFEGINRRFKEIFPKMFRGGRAELRLTDPNDLLETGIDILAQPPGKRLGNIELMSGGEKAFTAVSLLLAIFRFKPSPFCILDEVDAPLDDANVERYVEGIRAMTDRSQFILVTHSKRTMQAVDVLYGVTMQEPGVSKLVGVRVGDRGERSKTRSTPPIASAPPPEEKTAGDATAVA